MVKELIINLLNELDVCAYKSNAHASISDTNILYGILKFFVEEFKFTFEKICIKFLIIIKKTVSQFQIVHFGQIFRHSD